MNYKLQMTCTNLNSVIIIILNPCNEIFYISPSNLVKRLNKKKT